MIPILLRTFKKKITEYYVQSVTTDASATPTSNQVVMASTNNALVIHAGEQPISEAYLNVYISINGGAVKTLRIFRHQSRIIYASGNVSLGTTDGRVLKVNQCNVPGTLVVPSGVSGTANCDKAGAPLWTPSAAHVTLPNKNSAFVINTDGTERIVFISEFDGVAWQPYRFYILPASSKNLTVFCSYKQVALANYAGATLSITAPAGSVVGGSSVTMSLTIPAVTGTTHSVTNISELKTAIANAVSGDHIVLADGTYALDVNITEASFTANQAAGRKGSEGIVIRSLSGVRENCILSGSTTSFGGWTLNHSLAVGYGYFKDLKFDIAGTSTGVTLRGGNWRVQNCRFTGVRTAVHCVNMASTVTDEINIDMLYCQADTSAVDCFNCVGNSDSYSTNSVVRLIECTGFTPGGASGDQCVTTNTGVPLSTWGGNYYDAFLNVMAPDANTPQYAFFTTISNGARRCGLQDMSLFGCNYSTSIDVIDSKPTTGYVILNKVTTTGYGATTGLFRTASDTTQIVPLAVANRITINSGRAFYVSVGGTVIEGNIINTASDGVRFSSYSSGSTATTTLRNNTFKTNSTAVNQTLIANLPMYLRNNASKVCSVSLALAVGSMAITDSNYNTVDPTVSGNYTPGANDLVSGDAALDADDFPTAAGNCDANGVDIYNYIGSSDPFGFVLIYKAGVISRGARTIPQIVASADIYPDVY